MKNYSLSPFYSLVKLHILPVLVLLVLCLVISRTLFSLELPRTNDAELHGARLANYYLAIKQGQFPPRWAPNLNYGFGYPIFLYNYHFPYLVATFFYATFFSVEQSLNLVTVSSVFLTGIGWYLLIFFHSRQKAFAITLTGLVLTAPYFLLNIFVRGAVGEVTFFAAIPWVIFLLELFIKTKDQRWLMVFIPILTVMLLSHQFLSLLFLPFIFFYGISKDGGRRLIKPLIGAFVLSCLFVSFFYFPLAFEKNLIRLADDASVTNFQRAFVPFERIIWSNWNYGGMNGDTSEKFTNMIGPILFLVVIVVALKIFSKKTFQKRELYLLFSTVVSVFLMTEYSRFIWDALPFLKFIQFPWRLLQVILVSLPLFLTLNSKYFSSKRSILFIIFFLLSWIWIISVSLFWAKPISYISNSDHDWREYGKTADASEEFMPKSFDQHKNYEYAEKITFRKPSDLLTQLSSELNGVTVNINAWTGSKKVYQIDTAQEIEVIEKTMIFPGWKVIINGEEREIIDSKDLPGRVTYILAPGKYQVESFWSEDTLPRKVGNLLSLLGLGIYSLSVLYFLKNLNTKTIRL